LAAIIFSHRGVGESGVVATHRGSGSNLFTAVNYIYILFTAIRRGFGVYIFNNMSKINYSVLTGIVIL
jgi:hypothetical protein